MKQSGVDLFFSVGETCFGRNFQSVNGYSRRGGPLYVQLNTKKTKTSSSSFPAAVDSSRGLSFASREFTFKRTNHFVEAWTTLPRPLAMSFYWETWYFTVPDMSEFVQILSGSRAVFHSSAYSVAQPHRGNVFYRDTQ